MSKLFSTNLGGNIHSAVEVLNRWGLADQVVHMDCLSGHSTIVVVRLPEGTTLDRWIYDHLPPEDQEREVRIEVERRRYESLGLWR